MQPDWPLDLRARELQRLRLRVARRSRYLHPHAPLRIRVLPGSWADPRFATDGRLFNEDCVIFGTQGMLEALDGLAL